MASGSRSGSSISRRRSSGNCERCSSAPPASDGGGVDAADRREERDRLRDVLGEPLAVDLVVRDRGEGVVARATRCGRAAPRRCGPSTGPYACDASWCSGEPAGYAEMPWKVSENHLPVLLRVAEPLERDRRGHRAGEVVDELALARLDDLVERSAASSAGRGHAAAPTPAARGSPPARAR